MILSIDKETAKSLALSVQLLYVKGLYKDSDNLSILFDELFDVSEYTSEELAELSKEVDNTLKSINIKF